MIERFNFNQFFGFMKSSKQSLPEEKAFFSGKYHFEKWSQKKSGLFVKKDEFDFVSAFDFLNGITNTGKNSILNIMFAGATQIASGAWCLSLIDNSGFTALNSSDTMGSHTGWSEFTGYSGGVRPAWGPVTATAQLLTNTALTTFNITVSGNLYGGLVTSDNTIGGSAGILWSSGAFPAPVPVTGGTDQIRLSYNLTC